MHIEFCNINHTATGAENGIDIDVMLNGVVGDITLVPTDRGWVVAASCPEVWCSGALLREISSDLEEHEDELNDAIAALATAATQHADIYANPRAAFIGDRQLTTQAHRFYDTQALLDEASAELDRIESFLNPDEMQICGI